MRKVRERKVGKHFIPSLAAGDRERGRAGSEAWELGTPGMTPVCSPREQGEGRSGGRGR